MDHDELKRRIDMMSIDEIKAMSEANVARLTDDFKPDLLRLIVTKAKRKEVQRHIVMYLDTVHWDLYRRNNSALKDFLFDIECGLTITETGTVRTPNDDTQQETSSQTSASNQELTEAQKKIDEQTRTISLLREEIDSLKSQIQELSTLPADITALQKVRMELACQLLSAAGVSEEVLSKRGNKDKAGTVIGALLDIPAKTCKQYCTDRKLNRGYHENTILMLNPLLKELETNVQL